MRFSTLALAVACIVFAWSAVSSAEVRGNVQLDAMAEFPAGELAQHRSWPGFGGGLYGGVRLVGVPLVLGLSASSIVYEDSEFSERIANIPTARLTTSFSTVFFNAHLHARFQPFNSWIRPYIEGTLGGSRVSIEVERKIEENSGGELILPTHESDASYLGSYGFGGGVQVQIGFNQPPDEVYARSFLTLGFRSLSGGEVSFPLEGTAGVNGNALTFYTVPSRYESFTILFGFLGEM
ncbi:MAG: hypothetical protein SFV15_05085 [Polyangiaceae bacterium]|nr:hypothetical protein [Polyangiaceae bacterium]